MANSVLADRGIRVKKIADLNHGSGSLGEYKALIIGINDYKNANIPDLETAVSDAKALARILENEYGFEVKLLLDRQATREAIYRSLRRLAASTKPNDSVLIYFAGHGDLDRTYNDGWWIPADAVGGNPVTYFDNVQVQKAMRNMKARHVLLISDSCYSGTLFGKARSLPPVIDDKYYLNLYNEKSRWGMTSGNKTPVSDGGTGDHSVFAYQLIKELKKNERPFLSIQEIYTRIAPVIANNSAQTPICRPILNTGDQGGEFVFVASLKKKRKANIPEAQKSTMDKEMLFWKSVQDSDSPALFRIYLERFPDGFFAPIAKQKLESLNQKELITSIPSKVSKSRLYVEVEPNNAGIKILNIRPKFHQGIELLPGRYHVEVSRGGYKTKRTWIKLEKGRDRSLQFKLEQEPVAQTHIRKPVELSEPVIVFSEDQTVMTKKKPGNKKSKFEKENERIEVLKQKGLVSSNNIWKDPDTSLIWQKHIGNRGYSWYDAKNYCENMVLDGFSDWRVPTINELSTLLTERPYRNPRSSTKKTFIKRDLFDTMGMYTQWFWTSEEYDNRCGWLRWRTALPCEGGKRICQVREGREMIRADSKIVTSL